MSRATPHLELLAEGADRGGIERSRLPVLAQPVERRPVLRSDAAQRPRHVRSDGNGEHDRADERPGQDGGCRHEPDGDGDDERRRNKGRGPDREHLVGADFRHEPEGRHEGAEDASGRRDREEPSRRATEALERAGREPDGDRRGGGEDDARRSEEDCGRQQGIETRAGVPLDDPGEHRLVDHGHESDQHGSERQHGDEQVWSRHPVGDDTARPVADCEAGEHDADQRAPDVE